MAANEWRRDGLRMVHLPKPRQARGKACGTVGELLQIPQVREDPPAAQAHSVFGRVFECGELWWRELALLGEGFQRAIAESSGYERRGAGPAIKGEVERTFGPVQRLLFIEEWRLHQDECAERDLVFAQEPCGAGELVEGHALVQPREHVGMRSLQAHGYFEPGANTSPVAGIQLLLLKQIAEAQRSLAYQRRVTLHNHAFKTAQPLRDGWIILKWNCAAIKKTAAVIELHLSRGGKARQGVINLCGDGTDRNRLRERVLPQVAHQAAPGTLAIGEEDGRDIHEFAGLGPLLLEKEGVRPLRIEFVSSGPPGENPGINLRGV